MKTIVLYIFSTGIIGGGKMSKTLPSPSPSTNSTTSEDWTVLDTNEQGKNVPRGQSSNAIMNAFNKIKTGRKGSNPSLSTETQVCHRCKQVCFIYRLNILSVE